MKLLKTKAAKIAVAVCAAMAMLAVILTAVFLLRPGAGEMPAPDMTGRESTTAAWPGHAAQPELDGILSSEPARTTLAQSTAAISIAIPSSTQLQQTTAKTTVSSTSSTQTTKTSQTTSSTTRTSTSTSTTTKTSATTTKITTQPTSAPVPVQLTCSISISCKTLRDKLNQLKPEKAEMVPADGVMLAQRTVAFSSGESVFDVLKQATQSAKIPMELETVPGYGSAYIKGIGNIYELDCGQLSGWMYKVNGVFSGVGCSDYKLRHGDVVEFLYTCDLGRDIGGGGVTGQK